MQKCWTSSVVHRILNNELYYGNMVQHKRESISYKVKKRRETNPDEWIVVNNTHEAIINNNIREIVKERKENNIESRNRKRKDGTRLPVLFSGLLTCSDCGSKLAATTKRNKRCYRCSRYNMSGKNGCKSHFINEDYLLDYIKSDINRLTYEYNKSKKAFFDNLLYKLTQRRQSEIKQAKNELEKINIEIQTLENEILQTYEDKRNNIISHKMFSLISKNYDEKLDTLLKSKKEYDNIIKRNNTDSAYLQSWVNALIDISKCKTYTTKQLNQIIETIYIGNPEDKNRIRIKYRIGFIEDSENYLKIIA